MELHVCPPQWEVWLDEHHDPDADTLPTVHAIDAREAAERYVERLADDVESGKAYEVRVRCRGVTTAWVVHVETVRTYRADPG